MNSGGDTLARGGRSANFPASEPTVTQKEWDERVGGEQIESFLERLKKRAIVEGLTEEQFENQKAEAQRQVDAQIEKERLQRVEEESKIKFRAVQDRVIVQRIEVAQKVGDLYLPDETKEKPYEGIVVAVGPGRYYPTGEFVPVSLHEGDHVVFGKFSGTDIKIGSRDLLVLREEDIFVVKENT